MARRSGTMGLSDAPQDIIADVLGEEARAQGSVGSPNAGSDAGDGSPAPSPVSVNVVMDEDGVVTLPAGSKEIYRLDFMTPSGMLRMTKSLLPTGEEIWHFSIWNNPITAKQAAQILKEYGLVPLVPKDALPYLPDLVEG